MSSLLAAGFTRDQLAVICSDRSGEQLFANLPEPELVSTHPGGGNRSGGLRKWVLLRAKTTAPTGQCRCARLGGDRERVVMREVLEGRLNGLFPQ